MEKIWQYLLTKAMVVMITIITLLILPAFLLAADPAPAKPLDFATIIGYLAPIIVILLTQVLKIWIQSKYAPVVVLVLGGLAMLLNVGPAPGPDWIDSTVNVGYVSGVATLLYDLVRKLIKPAEKL